MKHFVHSGNWVLEGATSDDPRPRMVCRVARGGVKATGEEVGLGMGPGVRPEPGFVAQTAVTRAVLYIGTDEGAARHIVSDFDRRGRHNVSSHVRRQGVKLPGADYAAILPEGRFRLEGGGHLLRSVLGEDRSDTLLLFATFEGGGGDFGDVSVIEKATTATVLDRAHVRSYAGASLAVIAKMTVGDRLVIERIRARNQEERAEWGIVILTYHGVAAKIEFTEEQMSLRRWTEREAKVTA